MFLRRYRFWTILYRSAAPSFLILTTILLYEYSGNGIDLSTAHLVIPAINPDILPSPFQPDVQSDFPVSNSDTPVIPFIIHQVYQDVNIPQNVAKYVQTVVDKNPKWLYYFWTDDASRRFIAKRLPQMLPKWDKIKRGVLRADIIRYLALYEFGGAYLDLDVEVLRPFDVLTMKYPCIIPPEPFEHSVLLFNTDIILNNAIMFCRPKHPFLKMVLDYLIGVFEKDISDYVSPVDVTGPGMLTHVYKQYIKELSINHTHAEDNTGDKSPYVVKINLSTSHPNAILIPNTQYFTENIDAESQASRFVRTCMRVDSANRNTLRACADISRKGFIRTSNTYAFTIHHYVHSWTGLQKFLKNYFRWITKTVSVKEIAPKYIIY